MCVSRPRVGLVGTTTISLRPYAGEAPPRYAGMSPSSVSAPSARTIDRSGLCSSPRASEASTSVIASMHESMSSSSRTSVSDKIITGTSLADGPAPKATV
jgi:hypothetical protein